MSTTIPSQIALNPTLDRVGLQGNGLIAARRATATTTKQSIAIPSKYTTFILKNSGSNIIRFNFNLDANDQYFTLAAGATLSPITVNDKTTINFITATGTSVLEAILWG
jgi:hypothetical protein